MAEKAGQGMKFDTSVLEISDLSVSFGQGENVVNAVKNVSLHINKGETVAVVGVSANPVRPSYYVARYLTLKKYRVIGVNPGLAGQVLFGETVYGSLKGIPEPTSLALISLGLISASSLRRRR